MKKLLCIVASVVMLITSVSLTAFITTADTALSFNSKWGYGGSVYSALDIDKPIAGLGYYIFIQNYDEYKTFESKGLVKGYNKEFFNDNILFVNWLNSYNGDRGGYENPTITKGADGTIKFNYKYNISYIRMPVVAYDINLIELKKSKVSGVDFSKITVNVTLNYSNATSNSEPNTTPDENITLKMINILNYTSKVKIDDSFSVDYKIGTRKNYYFVINNYKDYTACGFTGKKAEFFKNNMLLVNCIYGSKYTCETFVNNGMVKDFDNNLIMSYNSVWKFPEAKTARHITDIIELKKSEVKNVDFSKLTVFKRNKFDHSTWSPGLVVPSNADTYKKLKMTYVDVSSVIAGNIKAIKKTQVKRLKVKPIKEKQLKVSWKKISGVKYEVKYSLKKGMKNAKVKKNIKKNKVILKKLKSGKKYFVKVRAYKTVNGNTSYGKWSKVVKKKVK